MIWESFWYQYAVGGVIFLVGMLYAWRAGEVRLDSQLGRRNLLFLVGGLAFFFGLHLFLMLASGV